jgi:hypothetical protein
MGIGFVRYTLRQHLNKFQNELNRKLFPTAAKVAEFDTTDLERADLQTMMTAFRTALGRAGEKPIMSVNEVRHFLRLNKVDGGDHGRHDRRRPQGGQQCARPSCSTSWPATPSAGRSSAEGNTIYLYDVIVASDADARWFGGVSAESFAKTLAA